MSQAHVCKRGFSLIELLLVVIVIALMMVALSYLSSCKEQAQNSTSPTLIEAGTYRLEVPADWHRLEGARARQARAQIEQAASQMIQRYSRDTGVGHGEFGIDEFNVVGVPDEHGWLVLYTMRIPPQDDYYATVARESEQKLEWGRQRGIVVGVNSHGRTTLAGGVEVYKADLNMKQGYRQVVVTHWSPQEPGRVSMAQLLLKPDAGDTQRTAALAVLDGLVVDAPATNKGEQ